jgi:hypothetical protein
MATPVQYVHYQQELESIAAMPDLVSLDMNLNDLKRSKQRLETTVPVHEKHASILKELIKDTGVKINMTQRMLNTLKILIHEQLKFIPNTLQYTDDNSFFCKALSNGVPILVIYKSFAIVRVQVEEVRQLRFYLATHEDDF